MNFADQLQRISQKLQFVRKIDPDGKRSFGADRHLYRLGKPQKEERLNGFEERLGIVLPEAYRDFLENVGSSIDSEQAGAGPYYGLFSLERIENTRSYEEDFVENLSAPCTLFPDMSDEQWKTVCGDDRPDPFCGMMMFGTQGCAFGIMLVLNGEHRGRVVYMDEDWNRLPMFVCEENFLDWYEHWLDEILAGHDLQWYGYRMSGDEETLLRIFHETDNEALKEKCVGSFAKFSSITETSVNFLEDATKHGSPRVKCQAMQMLVKFDYPRSKPYLAEAMLGDENEKRAAFQAIFWYAKKHYKEWTRQILSVLPEIEEEKTLDFAAYVLEDSKDFLKTLLKINDPTLFIRKKTIEELGKKMKPDRLDIFYEGLEDPSDIIVLTTLRSVRLNTEPGFLPFFEKLIDRYSQQYEQHKKDNPKDIDLALEAVTENMMHDYPRLSWSPRTIESTILWTIISCLKPYGPRAAELLRKMSQLPIRPIARDAEKELMLLEKIRKKQEKRRTFWSRLFRILSLR